nr:unnamed protein product [Spirometra erinaceieuropaei]
MGDRIGLTGDPLLFQYCELASSSAFSTPQNDSTLRFFKSISNVSSMNNISMDSQLSQEHAASVLGLFDGSLQESICTVDQKPPRKNCLHTNQNLRTRTVSAQAISFSLGNWTDSLESVNLKVGISFLQNRSCNLA